MRGNDRRGWRAAIASIFMAGLSLALSGQARGQYLTVYGGPIYNSSLGSGYQAMTGQPSPLNPITNPGVENGVGVASEIFYDSGFGMGSRAIRWDTNGNVTELPTLPSADDETTYAWAINQAGIVVGSSTKGSSGPLPVRWDASGNVTQLSGAPGEALALNSTGLTVGYLGNNAARWSATSTAVTILATLSSPYTSASTALAVNDGGTAVGNCSLGNELGSRAVRWNSSGTAVTELDNIGLDEHGGTNAAAFAINNAGTAVGYAVKMVPFQSSYGPRALRWDASGTAATQLDSSVDSNGYGDSRAVAINSSGVAVGVDYHRAVRWAATGTAETVLGNISKDPSFWGYSYAYDINDSGITVGYNDRFDPTTHDFLGNDAVMWMPDGSVVDLNDLIDPSSGWRLTYANAIDNNNWVSGVGAFDPDGAGPLPSYQRLFLIQVPEPASMTLLAIGVVTILSRRRMN